MWEGVVFLGGELLDDCSQKGVAAVLKERPDGSMESFWTDDTIFPSSVRGMATNDGLNIAVNYERAVGIEVIKPGDPSTFLYDKRWGDDNMAIRESSLINLSSYGDIHTRQDLSAGLSIYLTNITVVEGRPVLSGSLGGEPASTLH